MGQYRHPHTDDVQTAHGPAADWLLNKGYTEVDVVPVDDLKGKSLDAELERRGLPKTGTADERRAAVAAHAAAEAIVTGNGAELVDATAPKDANTVVTTPPDPTQA